MPTQMTFEILNYFTKKGRYKIGPHYFCAHFDNFYIAIKGTQIMVKCWFDRNFHVVAVSFKIIILQFLGNPVVALVSF